MLGERLALFEQLRPAAVARLQSVDHALITPTLDLASVLAGGALRSQRTLGASLGSIDLELFVSLSVVGRLGPVQLFALGADIQVSFLVVAKLALREDAQA